MTTEAVRPWLAPQPQRSPPTWHRSVWARRRATRIGSTWWCARGERTRLWPASVALSQTVQRAATAPYVGSYPDTSVIVGGRSSGFVIDVGGGTLSVSSFSEIGTSSWLANRPAPVRVGFDACERAAGGAIVAGVSTANPSEVVALLIDAIGAPGSPRRVPLPIRTGDLGVRVVPLPAGGAESPAAGGEIGRSHPAMAPNARVTRKRKRFMGGFDEFH